MEMKFFPRFIKIGIIIGINWTFQSILYMGWWERAFKILLELIFFVFAFILVFIFINNTFLNVFFALIIAHTLNWILNGHVFGLLKNFNMIITTQSEIEDFIKSFTKRCASNHSISSAAIFGSFSEENFDETSDLDIRIVKKEGAVNSFKACFYVFKERFKAFFNKFPIDIYLLNSEQEFHYLKEKPVVIYTTK